MNDFMMPDAPPPPGMAADFDNLRQQESGFERKPLKEWLGDMPEYAPDAVYETLKTDVAVCGAGIAGVAAARAAAEAGAHVILLEKSAHPQARSGQFAVVGGTLLKRWGMGLYATPAEIVNQLMRDASYRANQRILKRCMENIGLDFDWYLEGAPEDLYYVDKVTDPVPPETRRSISLMQHPLTTAYRPQDERYPCYPLTVQIRPSHRFILDGNLALAENTGRVKTMFHTPVKQLLREDGGRVYGLIAACTDGTLYRILARKGVVLATGDYACNRDMLSYYCPWTRFNKVVPAGIDDRKLPVNTGDGHRMGLWVGAKMEEEPHGVMNHNMGGVMGVAPFLLLNTDGERFINEDCPGQQLENCVERQRGRAAWQIFDANWPQQIPHMPYGHSLPDQVVDMDAYKSGQVNPDLTPMDGFASKWFVDAVIARGEARTPDEIKAAYMSAGLRGQEGIGGVEMVNARVKTYRADTLEELFQKAGLPVDAALAAVKRYNALAVQGKDDDFGKSGSRLFPIIKPPFTITQFVPGFLLATMSGLESDHNAHVLDEERQVIPGLYACGNVQGNRCGGEYPVTMPGLSHTLALTYGRIAGDNAANER